MSHLYSHPLEYRKILLQNYSCIGFVPGGKQVHLNKFAEQFSFGFVTHVTGKEVRANFLSSYNRSILGGFLDFGWVFGPL